jgi:serine/threonine-protein kinase
VETGDFGGAGQRTDPDPPAVRLDPLPDERQPAIEVGAVVARKYRVERVLGSGGMGVVVAATHLDLRAPRAIKVMHPLVATNRQMVARFLREARAASRIKSGHVARVHDVGRLESGAPYMVMEYLEGIDLERALRAEGKLPVREAVLYALQTCEALAEAHRRGLVHRDVKPANLFLTRLRDGSPCIKVLDFGIAKQQDEISTTATGALLGSPLYMSPEQAGGAPDLDGRTDIWSLGVVLYELMTGASPFKAPTILQVLARIEEAAPAPPSTRCADVPEGLDAVVLRCLEKDRDARYATVAELAAALAPFAEERDRAIADRVAQILDVAQKSPLATTSGDPDRPPALELDPVLAPPLTPLVPRARVAAAVLGALALSAFVIVLMRSPKPAGAERSAPSAIATTEAAPPPRAATAAPTPTTRASDAAPVPSIASATPGHDGAASGPKPPRADAREVSSASAASAASADTATPKSRDKRRKAAAPTPVGPSARPTSPVPPPIPPEPVFEGVD